LKRQPKGIYSQEAREKLVFFDNLAWKDAQYTHRAKAGSSNYYFQKKLGHEEYLYYFPKGIHAKDAKRRLPTLTETQSKLQKKEIASKKRASRERMRMAEEARQSQLVICTYCNGTGRARTFGGVQRRDAPRTIGTYGAAGGCPTCRGTGFATVGMVEKADTITRQGPRGIYNKSIK